MSQLASIQVSTHEFGDGRDRNLMYAVSPANLQAESLLAVVSLRHDNKVEVRLLRPGKLLLRTGQPTSASKRPLFALFTLSRQSGSCGF